MIPLPGVVPFLVLGLLVPGLDGAQDSPRVQEVAPSHPGHDLEIFLVTIGQGEVVYERFGHNAILFRNIRTGVEVAYHWGVFNFDQVDFIPRLIKGTMLYSMGPANFRPSLEEYRRVGRPVWVQRLALTPDQRFQLLTLVEDNYRPENRDYRYDYYRDNCSTRVRDMLDRVVGGAISQRFSADTTAHTYRWHTRRILREMPAYYLGIQFVLGPNADRPITVWEEMFLPRTLMTAVGEIQVPDGRGLTRPLVADEEVLFDSDGDGPPVAPPFAFPIFLLAGILWAAGLLWAVGGGESLGLGRRLVVALLGGGWSLLAGVGGSLLLGAWLFTDHFFWYSNYNLFQAHPFFLLLLLAFILFLATGRVPRWGRTLAGIVGGMAVLGLLLELMPGLGQGNAEILAFTLPMNLGLALAVRRLDRQESAPGSEGERPVPGS